MKRVSNFEYYFNQASDIVKHENLKTINERTFKRLVKQSIAKIDCYSHVSMLIDIRNILMNKKCKLCYSIPTQSDLCVILLSKPIPESDRLKAIRVLSEHVLHDLIDNCNRKFSLNSIKRIAQAHYDDFKKEIVSFEELTTGMKVIIDNMSDIDLEINQVKESIQKSVQNQPTHDELEEAQRIFELTMSQCGLITNDDFDEFIFGSLSNDIEDDLMKRQSEIISKLLFNDNQSIDSNQIIQQLSIESQSKIFLLNLFIDTSMKFIKIAVNKKDVIDELCNLSKYDNIKEIISLKINQNN